MRKARYLLSVILAVLVLTACTGSGGAAGSSSASASVTSPAETADSSSAETTSEPDSVQVGVILPTMREPRWLQDESAFAELLPDAGFTCEVMFSDGSMEMERANVEALADKGAEVIILCTCDSAAAAESVSGMKERGVTVIAYDRLITGTEDVDYFVTFDSFDVGKAQGNYLLEHAPQGKGIPLYLYGGAVADNNSFLLFEGAWSVLQPRIADGTFVIQNSAAADSLRAKKELTREETEIVLQEITTDWNFSVAGTLAENNLAEADTKKGEVLILAPNDSTARAIADCFAGDEEVSGYVITGQDAEAASIKYIIEEKQSMTVFKNPHTLAGSAVRMAAGLLNGKTPETDSVYPNGVKDVPALELPIEVIDRSNAENMNNS
ncbi:MAG: sugar-binding protein [Lachnospiraceae bacterium]|nr:sugar-binding protein [Lachnospiraceae bacterium]